MQIRLTKKAQKRKARNADILKDYRKLNTQGSMLTAIVDDLSLKYKVSASTVDKIIRSQKTINV